MQSVVTALVFDHALRIRLKAEVSGDVHTIPTDVTPAEITSSETEDEPDSLANLVTSGSTDANAGLPARPPRSTTTTAGASVSTPSTTDVTSSMKSRGTESSKNKQGSSAKHASPARKENNLIGKINNLVTSDLAKIGDGRDFMFVGEFTYVVYQAYPTEN